MSSERFTREGWLIAGHYRIAWPGAENPRRQGCRWSEKERQDMLLALLHGRDVAWLAKRHGRTESAVGIELERLEVTVPQVVA